jgi:hypothetical protein
MLKNNIETGREELGHVINSLFALREVHQSSTGFSPFKLIWKAVPRDPGPQQGGMGSSAESPQN